MSQLPLPFDDLDRPSLPTAVARRDEVLTRLADANGPAFGERAAAFVLDYLRRHGDSPGEDITDAALAAGVRPPEGDGRRFGPVYATLVRQGRIARRGFCARRHGNHTSGGNVWGLVRKDT